MSTLRLRWRASFTLRLLYNIRMTRTNNISVCIATFNEAANIQKCLSSVYDWVDEIILVDGSSTDSTIKLAQAFGSKVKVFSEKNLAMFHINKQKALDKATGTWILQLDADEEVTKELKEEINSNVLTLKRSNVETTIVAYWIPRLNYFIGRPLRKGGQYPDYTIRLYKNGVAKLPCRTVHEQATVKGKVGFLQNPMNHYPYQTFSDYLIKWDRYCDLEAQVLFERKIRPGLWLFLQYFLFKPKIWFVQTYFRHKAFRDGFAGYVFALFSSLRFLLIYIKLYEKTHQ